MTEHLEEATAFIRDALEFAYAAGLHEPGYDAIASFLAERRELIEAKTRLVGAVGHYHDRLQTAEAELSRIKGERDAMRERVAEVERHMRGLLHGLPEILETGGLVDEEGLIEAAWFMLTRPEVEAALQGEPS